MVDGVNITVKDGVVYLGIRADVFSAALHRGKNKKGWANFVIRERQTPSSKGHTHTMEFEGSQFINDKNDAHAEEKKA